MWDVLYSKSWFLVLLCFAAVAAAYYTATSLRAIELTATVLPSTCVVARHGSSNYAAWCYYHHHHSLLLFYGLDCANVLW